MADNSQPITKTDHKNNTLDWFMRGTLAKLGEMFDRLTGRNWQPSSSLATSELIEKLKALLDSKIRDTGARGRFVPHKITLKMQWNKFAPETENSDSALETLKNELLTAAVDHINDRRYHTFAPLELEIKQDYFTDGVKFSASFADVSGDDAEMNVTVPEIKIGDFAPPVSSVKPSKETYLAEFAIRGLPQQTKLFFEGNRRLSVGRTAENDLRIDDSSVSKIHASLVLNADGGLVIADTGSTNGTFINDQRISYGKAHIVNEGDKVKFGSIDVSFIYQPRSTESSEFAESIARESVVIGDFEFKSRAEFKAEPQIFGNGANGTAENHALEDAESDAGRKPASDLDLLKKE